MSYRFVSIAALAAALSAAPAIGQPSQAASAPKPVTKAEFTKNMNDRFANVDTNKDGFLSTAEITAVQTKALQRAAAEQQQALQAEFKKLDTNNNGSLSLAEFQAAARPIRPSETPAQMVAQLDSNKDGKVSAPEYRALPEANFNKMDANNDGTVTPQEVAAARGK